MISTHMRMIVATSLAAFAIGAVTLPAISAQDPKKEEEARKKKEAEAEAAAERAEVDRKRREAEEKAAEQAQSDRVKALLERKRKEVSAAEAQHGGVEKKAKAEGTDSEKKIVITDEARAKAAEVSANRSLADALKTEKGKLFNPFTDNKQAIAEGKQLWLDYSCNGCHGGTGGGGMCPPVTNERFVYGSTDDVIFRLIAGGSNYLLKDLGMKRIARETVVGPMPPYVEIIEKEEELWKIIAFVRSVYRGRAKKRDW